MVEQNPRDYRRRVLEPSRAMIRLARFDPGYDMDLGCRTVFGTLLDCGYTLEEMAKKEMAAHLLPPTRNGGRRSRAVRGEVGRSLCPRRGGEGARRG